MIQERSLAEREAGIKHAQRVARLDYNERMIKKAGMDYIVELRDLCENPLEQWRATHEDFDTFCLERLGYGEKRVRQIVAADNTRNLLLLVAETELHPVIREMKEDALRPLNALEKQEALEVLRAAIKLPSKLGKKKVTLAKIKLAKARVIPAAIGVPGDVVRDEVARYPQTVDADTHQPVDPAAAERIRISRRRGALARCYGLELQSRCWSIAVGNFSGTPRTRIA